MANRNFGSQSSGSSAKNILKLLQFLFLSLEKVVGE